MKNRVFVILTLLFCVSLVPYGTAQEKVKLFDGRSLENWNSRHPEQKNQWMAAGGVTVKEENPALFSIQDGTGVMVNGEKGNTVDIYSDYEFGDCILHIEFTVPRGSNSGVYFHGLYEIQVFDSYGKEKVDSSDAGGIYARYRDGRTYEGHPPRVNASKAPGEWQSFDVIFRGPRFDESGKKTENAKFLLVKHNGQVVHENVEVTGPTRAHMEREEAPRGPLMLQGDHGPVAYRNIILQPVQLP
ncbi:MAG: 3-keto-disaccharide hydrolase [bacterium]